MANIVRKIFTRRNRRKREKSMSLTVSFYFLLFWWNLNRFKNIKQRFGTLGIENTLNSSEKTKKSHPFTRLRNTHLCVYHKARCLSLQPLHQHLTLAVLADFRFFRAHSLSFVLPLVSQWTVNANRIFIPLTPVCALAHFITTVSIFANASWNL